VLSGGLTAGPIDQILEDLKNEVNHLAQIEGQLNSEGGMADADASQQMDPVARDVSELRVRLAYDFTVGGQGGATFNDDELLQDLRVGPKLVNIGLRSGDRLDRIELVWANGTRIAHGGLGGGLTEARLAIDEYLTTDGRPKQNI
jgi:hypothetical protein